MLFLPMAIQVAHSREIASTVVDTADVGPGVGFNMLTTHHRRAIRLVFYWYSQA